HARAQLALDKLHSDPDRYKKIKTLLKSEDLLDPIDARALEFARLAFEKNQLPEASLKKMADMSARISRTISTFRGKLDGKEYSNNTLLRMLAEEKDSTKRKAAWEALKQVGAEVGPDLVALAKVRNEGARTLGYKNYWEMKIRNQEFNPEQLMALFEGLKKLTEAPFRKMKQSLDAELARKFKVVPEDLKPWHYDNPFFQEAPPAEAVDMDLFYRDKKKGEITEIGIAFYKDVGLPVEDIIERSDLYERDGKDQHAFCEDMDRKGDVRILCNIRPTAEWMDTLLHELGHAVYDKYIDPELPFNLRRSNHAFTTEGVAMLFGALAKNPSWLTAYAGADPVLVDKYALAVLEQRRREQLIFCRWSLVMLNFEKALYEDPDQDLNKLWWDYVERFQMLTRPEGRDAPDWAAKPHFTIAPVYYHNYMMGELFAAQLRYALAKLDDHTGPTTSLSFNGRKDFGDYLKEKVFKPGTSVKWPGFVDEATGHILTAKYYGNEIRDF
ncbi:MAG: M2 family metallopeptidase, partial [Planctomycetota bacterium]